MGPRREGTQPSLLRVNSKWLGISVLSPWERSPGHREWVLWIPRSKSQHHSASFQAQGGAVPSSPQQSSWPQVTQDVVGGGQGHLRRASPAQEGEGCPSVPQVRETSGSREGPFRRTGSGCRPQPQGTRQEVSNGCVPGEGVWREGHGSCHSDRTVIRCFSPCRYR